MAEEMLSGVKTRAWGSVGGRRWWERRKRLRRLLSRGGGRVEGRAEEKSLLKWEAMRWGSETGELLKTIAGSWVEGDLPSSDLTVRQILEMLVVWSREDTKERHFSVLVERMREEIWFVRVGTFGSRGSRSRRSSLCLQRDLISGVRPGL